MTRTPQVSAWDEAQRMSDIATADWFIWAANHRLQQASRELAFHSYALNHFEDSFALQLAQLQQHVRTTPMRRRHEGPVHAALVERIQIMLMISRLLDRATRRLGEQAQSLDQMAEAAYREAQGPQDPPAN